MPEQNAHADRQATIYQAGRDLHVTHNAFYGSAHPRPAPFDLPQLRTWVERLAVDYGVLLASSPRRERARQEERIRDLRAAVGEPASRPGKDAVRALVVAGLVEYLDVVRHAAPVPLSERVALDVVVFALWPVVQASRLPDGWEHDLAELASPRLASLVAQARRGLAEGRSLTSARFTRVVAAKPLSRGVLALFEDLADPKRGGAVITGMALATGFPEPPRGKRPKDVFGWLVACVAIAGPPEALAVDEFADRLWEWLHSGTTTFTGGGFDVDGAAVAGTREARAGEPGTRDDLLDEIADAFFD